MCGIFKILCYYRCRTGRRRGSFYIIVVVIVLYVGIVMAGAGGLPSALNALPTAVAIGVLCVAVVIEITAVPAVLLPGGTMTLLAGALIGAGRPAVEVAVPMVVAVIGGDQIAYFSGAAVIGWWRRRRPGRAEDGRVARLGRAATWLTATMPSLAGAARMPYRDFLPRLMVMRVPWLAAALAAGTLAAHSIRQIGHVADIVGLAASAVIVTGLVIVHRRPEMLRQLVRGSDSSRRDLTGSPNRPLPHWQQVVAGDSGHCGQVGQERRGGKQLLAPPVKPR